MYAEMQDEADEGDSAGVDWRVLDGLLAKLARAPLVELALTGFESSRSLLEALDRVGFAPTLQTLDLSDSTLGDADAAWMSRVRSTTMRPSFANRAGCRVNRGGCGHVAAARAGDRVCGGRGVVSLRRRERVIASGDGSTVVRCPGRRLAGLRR